MSSDITYCFEDQDPRDAADLMGEKQIRRIPVLNREKRLVGVVSLGDIAVKTHQNPTMGQKLGEISRDNPEPRNL